MASTNVDQVMTTSLNEEIQASSDIGGLNHVEFEGHEMHETDEEDNNENEIFIPEVNFATDYEVMTLENYREQRYIENPGFSFIFVRREDFLVNMLGVYKDPNLNLYMKPKVQFFGEPGTHCGGLFFTLHNTVYIIR